MTEPTFVSRRLYTLKQFVELSPLFSVGGLQSLIRKRHLNGLAESGAILRMGGRYIVDADLFLAWMEQAGKK